MEKTFLQKILSLILPKVYTITPESFSEQFAQVDAASMKDISIGNPLSAWDRPLGSLNYKANQLKTIKVIDPDGKPFILQNSPALECKVILKSGKTHAFYFDTLVVEQGILMGAKSRFIPSLSGKIPFEDVELVKVKNGGKRYSY